VDQPDLELVFRREAGRLHAYLLRRLGPRHYDLAEDAVQDACVAAVRTWPLTGSPSDPRAWLLRCAHRKALDRLKRVRTAASKAALLAAESPYVIEPEQREWDDELAVLLLACHPALSRDSQVALVLRTLAGLSVGEVARALLITESAAAQRIVRAKQRLAGLGSIAPLTAGDLTRRVEVVLDVLYLLFNEGHLASAGHDLVRADLAAEAIRLGTLLSAHLDGAPRVLQAKSAALLALMHFQAARLPARQDVLGDVVLLGDQDRTLWDQTHLKAGFRQLERASSGREVSRFHLEAGIAALHAAAPDDASTNWPEILASYDALLALWPTSVVALNRAVALAKVYGPRAGLEALRPLESDPALRDYLPFPVVRAELLRQAGDLGAARAAYDEALARPASAPQRRFLVRRREALG
jgi:RNA polymerase sigma-70 factor (ECF subfamily)